MHFPLPKEKFGEPPMPIWKSSMSALIPRQAANFIVDSLLTMKLIRWLEPSGCPDESFWATVTGNAGSVKNFNLNLNSFFQSSF